MKLEWGNWLYGLVSGFIGGGASAISSFVANNFTDPKDFNLGSGLHHTLVNAGVNFLVAGGITAFAYLKQSPLPKDDAAPAIKP